MRVPSLLPALNPTLPVAVSLLCLSFNPCHTSWFNLISFTALRACWSHTEAPTQLPRAALGTAGLEIVLPGAVEAADGEPQRVQHLQGETGTALLQPPGLQPQPKEEFGNAHMLRYGPMARSSNSAESRAGLLTHKSLTPPEQEGRSLFHPQSKTLQN